MCDTIDPNPPLRCADVNHDSAFGRARGIIVGHSVMCASFYAFWTEPSNPAMAAVVGCVRGLVNDIPETSR